MRSAVHHGRFGTNRTSETLDRVPYAHRHVARAMRIRIREQHVEGYETRIFELRIGGEDYRIRALRDRQQFHDPDGEAERIGISSATWPIFGQLWPGGTALAEAASTMDVHGRCILEFGCGLGLISLVLRRRGADITACDIHPLAEEFLRRNAELNGLPPIPYRHAPWDADDPSLGRYDLLLGGDVLYERDHAHLLAGFLERHANPTAQIVIGDPGRGHGNALSRILAAQGWSVVEHRCAMGEKDAPPYRGRLLYYSRGS
jgi:predicted nicotinamide N-methyase